MLANVSDGTIVLAASWSLLGYALGFAFAVVVFWRRISHRDGGELRLLRMALDDTQRRADDLARVASDQRRVIDEQTRQIGALYADNDRLARLYVERAVTAKGWNSASTSLDARGAA